VRGACFAEVGLSVTGIAGPAGGTEAKPVGLTYVGVADEGGVVAEEHRLRGDRLMVKERAAQMALWLLFRRLRDQSEGAA
jgi:nicotinamide mononucleotide (NMN) deamidase PncC